VLNFEAVSAEAGWWSAWAAREYEPTAKKLVLERGEAVWKES
jgi:hypothetical protein